MRGPLKQDRLFLSQDFQYRYVATPVKSLVDEPEIKLTSVDSFTRVDSVLSTRHTVGGGIILFPREIGNVTMDTFRPPEVAPDFHQTGVSTGLVDRFGITPDIVLESTFSGRWFEIDVNTDGVVPMTYAPETQSGLFFNDQEREVHSVQLVEALSISKDRWLGHHVFKFGFDLQNSGYSGTSNSRPVEVRRLDESLAELTLFSGPTVQVVNGTELAILRRTAGDRSPAYIRAGPPNGPRRDRRT